jgi:hypothetical protein
MVEQFRFNAQGGLDLMEMIFILIVWDRRKKETDA